MKDLCARTVLVIGLLVVETLAAEVTWRTGERLPDTMTPGAIHERTGNWKAQHAQGGLRDRHGGARVHCSNSCPNRGLAVSRRPDKS